MMITGSKIQSRTNICEIHTTQSSQFLDLHEKVVEEVKYVGNTQSVNGHTHAF